MKKTAEAIVVLVTFTASLAAETRKERVTWAEVASATSGAKITMMLPGGTEIRGRVLEVEPQALVVDVTKTSNSKDVEKGRASIPRSSASTIHARKCGVKWRAILGIGLPAALLAATAGAINAQSTTVKGGEAYGVGVAVAAGSAVAGYFIGRQLDCHDTDIAVIPEDGTP